MTSITHAALRSTAPAAAYGRMSDQSDLKHWMACLTGVRLELLLALAPGPARVHELRQMLQLDYPTVSHSLGELRQMRCVLCERDGRCRIYRLSSTVRIEPKPDGLRVRLILPEGRHIALFLPAGYFTPSVGSSVATAAT